MSAETEAADWARAALAQTDAVILDTETTGLHGAEIVQIGILSMAGQVLLDTLVKPSVPITTGAQRVHGISAERVADAPTMVDLLPQLREILGGARVLIYNASYDLGVLENSLHARGVPIDVPLLGAADYDDVMEPYSAWVGDWNDYYGNYRWQKLPGGDHTAIGDCRATLAVLQRIAGRAAEEVSKT